MAGDWFCYPTSRSTSTTRHVAAGVGDAVANARVHTPTGHWLIVRGSLVGADRVAILLETARPAEQASAIADAYGFAPS
jgi:hypothetical protein